jgi:predicted nucleotidyltransferase
MKMDKQVETILAELRGQLEELYGDRLVHLVLFGSRARGDAEPGSDIDVMVVLKGPISHGQETRRTSDVRLSLSLQHDIHISFTYVSEDGFAAEQSPLLINVRREGVRV